MSDLATALPPGPRLPTAVQTLRWVVRPTAFMEECRRRYGDVFTLSIASEGKWVMLADPDAIKQVFKGDPERLRAGEGNAILRPLLGSESVLLLDGPRHLRQRKLLLPPFHGERMQRYGEVMREVTEREIARWPVGTPFAAWPRMQAITLEVIVRTVFGVDEHERLEELAARIRPLLGFTSSRRRMLLIALAGPERLEAHGWNAFSAVIDPVDALLREEIRRRAADPDLTGREDILSLLLQARDEDGEPMG
jgi:cytochrome P450